MFAEGTGVKESQLQGKVGAKGEAAGEVCHFDLLELLFGAPREQTAPIPLLVLEGLKGGKLARGEIPLLYEQPSLFCSSDSQFRFLSHQHARRTRPRHNRERVDLGLWYPVWLR